MEATIEGMTGSLFDDDGSQVPLVESYSFMDSQIELKVKQMERENA